MFAHDVEREFLVVRIREAGGTVPQRMEVVRHASQPEGIAASITVGMQRRNVADAVQRLMDVAEQVDQPAQRVHLFLGFGGAFEEV